MRCSTCVSTDEAHWIPRLQQASPWRVADEAFVDPEVSGFARLALFFAWHVAAAGGLAARLLLGMNGPTVRAFRETTMDRLPTLVASEAVNLTARWNERGIYWTSLLRAAARPNVAQFAPRAAVMGCNSPRHPSCISPVQAAPNLRPGLLGCPCEV